MNKGCRMKLKSVATEFVLCNFFAIIFTLAVGFVIVILPFFRALDAWETIRAVILTIVGVWTHKKLFLKITLPQKIVICRFSHFICIT